MPDKLTRLTRQQRHRLSCQKHAAAADADEGSRRGYLQGNSAHRRTRTVRRRRARQPATMPFTPSAAGRRLVLHVQDEGRELARGHVPPGGEIKRVRPQ